MTPLELARQTAPQIGTAGAAFYFVPETLARGKELGLDGFRFYVLGRGGVLGDVEPTVVSSAFGYFNPEVLAGKWNTAKEVMAPRQGAREYSACAEALGRARLADVDGLGEFNAAAEKVTGAVDVSGLTLFAGMVAEPLPDDAPARAMRNTMLLRELRGSVHLVAIAAEGLPSTIAHAIRRPDDQQLFGWQGVPDVTDDDRAALERVDQRTDELMAGMLSVLDDGEREALADGAAAILAAVASG